MVLKSKVTKCRKGKIYGKRGKIAQTEKQTEWNNCIVIIFMFFNNL